MRLFSRTFLTLMVLAAAGCGSGDTNDAAPDAAGPETAAAGGSAAKTDPCSLVTAGEMGEIIGDTVVATKSGEGGCTWETQDAQASSVTIELNQTDAAGQMDIAKRTAGFLKDMGAEAAKEGGAAGQDVNAVLGDSGDTPKVGDEAFFGANNELSVRKSASYIAIAPPIMRSRMAAGNPMLSSDDKKKMALAIAEKALARLP